MKGWDLNLHLTQTSAGPSGNLRRPAAGSGAPLWQHSQRSGADSACPGSDTGHETGTVGNHRRGSGDSLRSAGSSSRCRRRRWTGCWTRGRGPRPPAPLWPSPPPPDGEGAAEPAMWRRWLWWSERRRSALLLFPVDGMIRYFTWNSVWSLVCLYLSLCSLIPSKLESESYRRIALVPWAPGCWARGRAPWNWTACSRRHRGIPPPPAAAPSSPLWSSPCWREGFLWLWSPGHRTKCQHSRRKWNWISGSLFHSYE